MRDFLWMFISIMAFRSEGQVKSHSIYEVFIEFHRSVMLVLVLGVLIKSPTVYNAASQKTRPRNDNN